MYIINAGWSASAGRTFKGLGPLLGPDLGPGVAQGDGPVKDRAARASIRIATEIPLAFELHRLSATRVQ